MQLPVRVGISARLGRQHSNAGGSDLQCGAGRIHPPEAAAAAAAAAVAAVAAATSSEPGSPAAAAAAAVVLPRGIVEGWSRVLLPLGRRCVLYGGGGGVRGSRDEQELEARHRRLAVCERVVIVRSGCHYYHSGPAAFSAASLPDLSGAAFFGRRGTFEQRHGCRTGRFVCDAAIQLTTGLAACEQDELTGGLRLHLRRPDGQHSPDTGCGGAVRRAGLRVAAVLRGLAA